MKRRLIARLKATKPATRLWAAQMFAFALILAVGYIGFKAGDEQRAEHRQVTANVVCGIGDLITDLVTPPAEQKLTAEQEAYIKRTLERLEAFERDQLEQLDKECEATP